ncbi:MAG: archease [Candidatus Eisenbacteria bacterium]|nr:archease [Candidatus Eisenbacteria bacterium]
MDEGFRTFDHTGDLGLEVWAATPERLYGLAAEALLAQVVETQGGEADETVRVSLAGEDPADLLVHWLNTALLEAELRRAVWTRAAVHRLSSVGLEATLTGPRRDPAGQTFLREVKAVSHHGLTLDLAGRPCRCRLVLDI